MARVAVVGAGIIGLSSAVNIQQLLPGARVTIIADRFGNETTSSGAGGLFRPNPQQAKGVHIETLRRWAVSSWEHFSKLALSNNAAMSGNSITNGFYLHDESEKPYMEETVFTAHKLSAEEMEKIKSKTRYGYNITTVVTEPKKYLSWLMNIFKANGGKIVVKTLKSLKELCGQCDVVVNCCGLRADQLVGDTRMKPNRGQLVMVRAPNIRGFYYLEHEGFSTYAIPHADYLIVGGCRQDGNTSEEIDPVMTQNILDRANKLIPGFQGATVVSEWAGIRPNRTPIRLEEEKLSFGDKSLKVVHNYGHGGHGISLSWGTAVHAASLVKDIIHKGIQKSKL